MIIVTERLVLSIPPVYEYDPLGRKELELLYQSLMLAEVFELTPMTLDSSR